MTISRRRRRGVGRSILRPAVLRVVGVRCGGRAVSEKSMNAFVLFLVLLKATLTSFAGLASISVVRDELVVQRHVLTDA